MSKKDVPDRTGCIPFVLFGIFAIIIGYAIYKGTHMKKTVQMEEDVIYIEPKAKL